MRAHHLFSLIFVIFLAHGSAGNEFDDGDEFDDGETDVKVENNDEEISNFGIEYDPPTPLDSSSVYFHDSLDDPSTSSKTWTISSAQKPDTSAQYTGLWAFAPPLRPIFTRDSALVLKSKAAHAAIGAKLRRVFEFNTKPLFLSYEVNFQNGMECGGAYVKLLSVGGGELSGLTDKTPYTIMFGPDKCGNDYKLHFIFRHKNPLNGSFEEKHANQPLSRLEENYSDKKPHLYTLKLRPDNTFEIFVDNSLEKSGTLHADMTPSVNPPTEIPDVTDKKPIDWDERELITDENAKKPDDWDDDAPEKINDPNAHIPAYWLLDTEPLIPDPDAKKPDDWDESMDGEWEAGLIKNPACEGYPGCGPWNPPQIQNPAYKGKWKPPLAKNPNYQGRWKPRLIPNPNYFDDKEPFKMTPISGIGIEIWTMTDMVLFDNFMITDSEKVLEDWIFKTWGLKKQALDKDSKSFYGRLMRKINYHVGAWSLYLIYISIPILLYSLYLYKLYREELKEGVLIRTLNYTNAHPWLWGVYVVVIALPIVLILTFCCGSSQEKEDSKKTDELLLDDDFEDGKFSEDIPPKKSPQIKKRGGGGGKKSDLETKNSGGKNKSDLSEEEEDSTTQDSTPPQPKKKEPSTRKRTARID